MSLAATIGAICQALLSLFLLEKWIASRGLIRSLKWNIEHLEGRVAFEATEVERLRSVIEQCGREHG